MRLSKMSTYPKNLNQSWGKNNIPLSRATFGLSLIQMLMFYDFSVTAQNIWQQINLWN